MNQQLQRWIYLTILSVVWGGAFILIKKSLIGFTPTQLIALRVFITSLFLFLIGYSSLKTLSKKNWFWISISGCVGTLLPIALFSFAQTKVSSCTASILNTLIPLITLLIGYLGFKAVLKKNQITGLIIGLIGAWILIVNTGGTTLDTKYSYSIFIVLACFCNAYNINIVKYKLQHVNPIAVATGNFLVILIPAFLYLYKNQMFYIEYYKSPILKESLFYVVVLAICSTAFSRIIFNKLIQISTPVFSSTTTYLIPVVALFFGLLDGEEVTYVEITAMVVIFSSIYLVNYQKKKASISKAI